jgi:hypothetical protein
MGFHWIGLDWIGWDWIGWDWITLDCTARHFNPIQSFKQSDHDQDQDQRDDQYDESKAKKFETKQIQMRTQNYMRFNELIEWSRQQDYI